MRVLKFLTELWGDKFSAALGDGLPIKRAAAINLAAITWPIWACKS